MFDYDSSTTSYLETTLYVTQRRKSTKFDSETLYPHHSRPVPEFMLQTYTSFKLFQAEICNPAGLPSSLTSDTPELLF